MRQANKTTPLGAFFHIHSTTTIASLPVTKGYTSSLYRGPTTPSSALFPSAFDVTRRLTVPRPVETIGTMNRGGHEGEHAVL
jgi:hypothetical protein